MEKLKKIIDKDEKVIIGIMSGTSLDGIDVSLSKISGSGKKTNIDLIDYNGYSYDDDVKADLLNLVNNKGDVADVCYYNSELGRIYGKCALDMMNRNNMTADDVDLICSHGQTLFHIPEKSASLQVGDANIIAGITGVITLADFRMGDIAAGGFGAPLAPFFDYIYLTSKEEDRIVINIGGISNFTVLNKACKEDDVYAFDCGPGNMLIDRAISILTDGKLSYDDGGKVGLRGTVKDSIVDYMFSLDDFVKVKPPKTTGRELYNESFVVSVCDYAKQNNICFDDIIASITCYTAKAIAYNITNYCDNKKYTIYVGGGGANNKAILQMVEKETKCTVKTLDKIGVDADAKEAIAFSVFGNELLCSNHNNLKGATGATKLARMGKIAFPYF